HLAGDSAVDRNRVAFDVVQDAVIRCGFSANVMFSRQSIDRYSDREQFRFRPLDWNRSNRARHKLNHDSPRLELRENLVQLTKPNERLPANNGNVQRLVLIDKPHEAINEFFAFEVADLLQNHCAAQMVVAICVTAGAGEWTLPRQLD